MKFTTQVLIPLSNIIISHDHPLSLMGSCFTQNIGAKLIEYKFDVNINPNGIIFNPISLVKALKRIFSNQLYAEKELNQHNEKWFSFDHHGSFSSLKKEDCLEQINTSLTNANSLFVNTKTIFITFGSAWVYEYPEFGIVANCHKIPNKQFTKRLLSVKEILTVFDEIKELMNDLNIIFTVSPVRHVKDGLHENNLSKSILLLAINNLVEQNENYHYFPAYELVVDELRDYRFYKDDLVHPTDLAINYVWDKFCESFFNEKTNNINTEIQKIKSAVKHIPFSCENKSYQKFLTKQIQLIDKLSIQYPFLDFEQEKKSLLKYYI